MADEILDDEIEDKGDPTLDMSDEDFLKADPASFLEEPAADTGDEDGTDGVVDGASDEGTEGDPAPDVVDPGSVDDPDPVDPAKTTDDKTEDTDKDPDPEPVADPETKDPEVDYKAEYGRVMAPFKANGTTIQPKSIDDLIQLAQQGANYHKKMAGMKPSMKMLKLLEKNDLLDSEKLNYLIDLNNKNPAAITKLLKESGMDPLDINVTDEPEYKPTSRNVSDTEINLSMVLESIKDTPSYQKTLNVVSSVWDDASRSVVASTPHIIEIINGHVADGTYDQVMGAVTYERSLGRLQGVTDLDAYKQMGDELSQKGLLNPGPGAASSTQAPTTIKPKAKPDDSKERLNKKKAASPTHGGGTPAAPSFNPLEMSDEEIEKFDERNLPPVV